MPDPAATASGTPGVTARRITALDVLRVLTELLAFASLALWGFFAWPFPGNVVAGIGAPVLAVLVWALFVSPRAVFSVHPFLRALVELGVFVAATIALWDLGLPWAGLGFGVIAVAVGLVAGRRMVS
jgi:ABC-type amino acid transport system permease subunit